MPGKGHAREVPQEDQAQVCTMINTCALCKDIPHPFFKHTHWKINVQDIDCSICTCIYCQRSLSTFRAQAVSV